MKKYLQRGKSDFINAVVIKPYNPGLYNRNNSGEAKTVTVGGTERACFSSQCMKSQVRRYIGPELLRSSHVEDLVNSYLKNLAEQGTIENGAIDVLGNSICILLGVDWDKRTKKEKTVVPDDDKEKAKKKEEEGAKGRTVTVATPEEIRLVVEMAVDDFLNGPKLPEKEPHKALVGRVEKNIVKALEELTVAAEEALTGRMATSGVLETVDGAMEMGTSYSIDAYQYDFDDWIAKFSSPDDLKIDGADPFFGNLAAFCEDENSKPRSQAMGAMNIYSNTMFSQMNVNVRSFMQTMTSGKNPQREEFAIQKAKEIIPAAFEGFALVEPSGKQRSASSHIAPIMYYVEVIRNGRVVSPYFERPIDGRKESIAQAGINRMLSFAQDRSFDIGDIERYVIFSGDYKDNTEAFEKAGVHVIDNIKELTAILGDAVDEMIAAM